MGFPEHHPPMRALLGVPITIRENTFGSLYLTEPAATPEFTESDEIAARALASAAAVAIDNARLFDRVQCSANWMEASRAITTAFIQRLFAAGLDLQGTIDDIRTTIFALHSRPEAVGGFRQQIQNAVAEITDDCNIETKVRFSGPLTVVGDELAAHALPVTTEALSNAVRHSGAKHLLVLSTSPTS